MTNTTARKLHPVLPIYTFSGRLYTPGLAMRVSPECGSAIEEALLGSDPINEVVGRTRDVLVATAEKTIQQWDLKFQGEFCPTKVLFYAGNQCNCRCSYCYSRPHLSNDVLQESAGRAAIAMVGENSVRAGKPLGIHFHGGGEPTLHWRLMERLVFFARDQFGDPDVTLSTNGVVSSEILARLLDFVDHVRLSCDGPREIHDGHRTTLSGKGTWQVVNGTLRTLLENGIDVTVRSTITLDSAVRQSEIVDHFVRLGVRKIHFEPYYAVAECLTHRFVERDADEFAEKFLEARRLAQSNGATLHLSGVRIDSLHGPHCPPADDTLQVLPNGTATACFFDTGDEVNSEVVIGRYNGVSDRFDLDTHRIAQVRARYAEIPEDCAQCINAYHCTRGCPEICYQRIGDSGSKAFRCRLYRVYTLAVLSDAVCEEIQPSWLNGCHDLIDCNAVEREAVAALKAHGISPRAMPRPIWAQKGFTDNPARAWDRMEESLRAGPDRPASIYVHVPFCASRCSFCDCYSVVAGRKQSDLIEVYMRRLRADLSGFAGLADLSDRSITTVHFGGGTPNHLGIDGLRSIVDTIREYFSASGKTEWALESTSRLLTEEHLADLLGLGFTRLHVGVQTLDDGLRRHLGRCEKGSVVENRLRNSIAAGMVTTVDVIFGLPGQSALSLLMTLDRLIQAGVQGVSLYSLQESPRNAAFHKRHFPAGKDMRHNFLLFSAAERFLGENGFRKNHFTHFARQADENLYYTYPLRNEDLFAFGPSADGVIGSYSYRWNELPLYTERCGTEDRLIGGIDSDEGTGSLSAQLKAGRLTKDAAMEAGPLLSGWMSRGLIEWISEDVCQLTPSGSWFIERMLIEARSSYDVRRSDPHRNV